MKKTMPQSKSTHFQDLCHSSTVCTTLSWLAFQALVLKPYVQIKCSNQTQTSPCKFRYTQQKKCFGFARNSLRASRPSVLHLCLFVGFRFCCVVCIISSTAIDIESPARRAFLQAAPATGWSWALVWAQGAASCRRRRPL